jgi:hypothetical protein
VEHPEQQDYSRQQQQNQDDDPEDVPDFPEEPQRCLQFSPTFPAEVGSVQGDIPPAPIKARASLEFFPEEVLVIHGSMGIQHLFHPAPFRALILGRTGIPGVQSRYTQPLCYEGG